MPTKRSSSKGRAAAPPAVKPTASSRSRSASRGAAKVPQVNNYNGIGGANQEMEFGGPWGVFALIVWSHYILFYFWYCYQEYNGQFQWLGVDKLWNPQAISYEVHWAQFTSAFWKHCIPKDFEVIFAYVAFFVAQVVLAAIVPGKWMDGLPTKEGKKLKYLCNGYLCYYICLWGLLVVDFFDYDFSKKLSLACFSKGAFLDCLPVTYGWGKGIYPLTHIYDNFGEYLFVSTVIGDLTSVGWYVYGIMTPQPDAESQTGNVVYDFFMGSVLYPRFGIVDIKMIAECRWSWLTLLMITLSSAVHQMTNIDGSRDFNKISWSMWIMLFAHWLYSNATVKGEHYIPGTWDMFHEKFGWMLNFWNITGVPFLYCFQSLYITKNQDAIDQQIGGLFGSWSDAYYFFVLALLTVGYYIFDTANCQKASLKFPNLNRDLFPHMPWAVLKNPQMLETPSGRLLIDGWYKYARKMQYTGDIMMAASWALACGFHSLLPYFYLVFFTCMINHRQGRDEVRCREKYGKHWATFTKLVPNVFVPDMAFFNWLFFGVEKDMKY